MKMESGRFWAAVLSALVAASCGGGGGSSSAVAPAPTPAGGAPTTTSSTAATTTAQNNALCGSLVTPYYWEIGDRQGALASGSVGTDSSGNPVLSSTNFPIASASKWIYSTYVTQLRGSAANLTSQDINFLHFTSGYTNMGDSGACPSTLNPNTVNECLTLTNSSGVSFSAQDPTTVDKFDYDGGHMENHASQFTNLGNVDVGSLGQSVTSALGLAVDFNYTVPLMSGGIFTNAATYATILREMLTGGSLFMHDALGTNPVCTRPSGTCNAVFSPIPEAWHYSIGHWVEDDPSTNGDGSFSSTGAFGFYPWIDSSKTYYGIISRAEPTGTGEQQGYASVQCGRLIRKAWLSGAEQTGPIPSP
jgi:hypothetical protein